MAEQEKRRRQGDWSAVRDAVTVRMKQLGISRAELHRRSGLADNTLRRIIEEEGAAESTLVLTAAILGWPYPFDGLKKILGGEPQKNERPPEETSESEESVLEERFREKMQNDLHQVKEDLAELRGDVNSMNMKLASIAAIMQGWDHGPGRRA